MINIISTFYVSKYSSHLDIERSKELEASLKNNFNSPLIEKIHLFVDDNDAVSKLKSLFGDSNKIHIIAVGKKPKYTDFFNYILNYLPNNICMIINSDIYLHSCDLNILNKLNDNKIVYALTRHEYDMSCPLINEYYGSHDAYIFNSKFLSQNIINQHTNFYQNFPGIESRIIKSFYDEGYTVYNPCKQILIVHLHKTQLRNHGQWIGLHAYGDVTFFRNSCWCISPIIL
jgi:hypothetical protein